MREKQKIRGLRKRRAEIERWISNSLSLDLDRIKKYQYEYTKIYVYPWSNLFCNEQPPSDYRNQITSGLIDIYMNWRTELEKLDEPYYLKIWLSYPRFMKSQVVAGIGERIQWYNNVFPPVEEDFAFPISSFTKAEEKISKLNWTPFLDEDTFFESDVEYTESQKFINRIREKHDKKIIIDGEDGEDICYTKTRGIVWCGSLGG